MTRSAGIAFLAEFPKGLAAFQAAGGSGVQFTKVHIVLNNPDGSVALDTVVNFPANAEELQLTLSVPLPANAPATGQPLALNLDYVNAAGQTVFHGGPVTVTAVPATPGAGPPAPSPVTIPITYTGPGATATRVAITPRTQTVTTGAAFAFSARALDAAGNVVPNTPIVFAVESPGLATINAATGVGTAGNARGTTSVIAQLLTGPSDAATLTITAPASRLQLVSGAGQTAAVNAALPSPVVVQVLATDGQPAAGVAVTFAAANGGTATPATATTDAGGTASTTWKLGGTVGAQTLTVASAGLTGSPLTVGATATTLPAARVLVTTPPPASTAAGTAFGLVATVVDATGALVPSYTGAVTVALGAGAPAGAALAGTTTVNAVAGVASFTDLKLTVPGTYTLGVTSASLTGATTPSFQIVAGSANRLAFQAYPVAGAVAGAVLDAITVQVRDALGNAVTTYTGPVTLTLASGVVADAAGGSDVAPAGGDSAQALMTGPLTVNAVAGVASFANVQVGTAGAWQFAASATGLVSVTGPVFTVTPGAASAVTLVSGGGQTAGAGTALAQPIVVKVSDAFGNGISGRTVTFAPAAGSVSAPTAVTSSTGLAQTTWTLGPSGGTQTLNVSSAGLTPNPLPVTATATGAVAGVPTQLVFGQQPTLGTAGAPISPTITVQVKDGLNALVTGFTGNVTLAIGANPGTSSLAGTLTVAAVAGVASFSAVSLDKAGTGYTLVASSGSLTPATSSGFNILPAAPAKVVFTTQPTAVGVATNISPAITVAAKDAYGNVVTSYATGISLQIAVNPGAATLGGSGPITPVSGIATFPAVTLSALGTGYKLRAVSGTLVQDTSVAFNVTSGAVASTALNTRLDSLFSLTDTVRKVATSKDAGNNVVGGTYTWVSRNAAVATVNTSGLITAVANGTTYVVVTESGGTKDSTLVAVQQRVATINVTPGTRNIYRGASFTFTASAVDGRGVAMTAQPTFTWSSTATAVASVTSSGVVSALTLGATQIRATANAITGVSNVTILTPITRIVVGRDSSGVPSGDTTSITSLGVRRTFRAQARDTLDAPMSGVTFTWASTNASVALIDTAYATSAAALSNANGIATIQATADGVTGSGTQKVSQVLASLTLSAATTTIAPTGTVQIVPQPFDANGRGIAFTLPYTYASTATGVASVSGSGLVTGVALGNANMTATSGAVTSAPLAITVANTGVPAIISFGRDTLAVGRGSGVSIPILLSKPNAAAAVVVNLAARDTNAYFSVASVTIPANQTSVNVTLNGRNAGTTQIYATDGGGTGYTGDTAVVQVQANIRFNTSSWSLNAGDQVSAQVLLSDPSPAGGTYVTYTYGTAGKAQVSPDPAFIPAGQLASNVVITALGSTTGSTTITPTATGVNGTASTMYVSAPILTISAGATGRLGAGQYEPNWYVYTPQYTSIAVPLTFTSTDTNIVRVAPATGAIPSGSYYQYFTVSGVAVGTAKVIVSASGWTPDTLAMTITSPRLGVCCGTTLNTTSPINSMTVYAEDSLGTGHYRTSSLALTISSSDTNVIKILDKNPSIPVGQYYISGVRYQPGGSGGTAYIKATAGGHAADSMLVTVVGPKLEFSWCCTNQVGKGQFDQNQYVYTPNNVVNPLTVTITSANAGKVTTTPTTVTIPAGSYYAYFNVNGLDTTASNALVATAPGYQGDTAYYRVSSPRVTLSGGGTFNNFNPNAYSVTAYATDTNGNAHYRTAPLAVTVTSTDTNVVKLDSSSVTIAAGTYYNNTPRVTIRGLGTAYVVVTAPGHRPDSVAYTVQTPKLNFSFYNYTLGRRQSAGANSFYVYTPDNQTAPLNVTFTRKQASVASLTTTAPTIPAGSYYAYFDASGLAVGTDTIIASAAGYLPDTAFITVTTTKFTGGSIASTATTTNPNYTTTVYATDVNGNGHYVLDTVVVHVVSSDTNVIRPTQAYVRILPGQYYAQPTYAYMGPGTATLTYSDSAGVYTGFTSNAVTVTGPSLVFSSSSAMYGMRQQGSGTDYYVYTANNVATPLTVTLTSTATRVATVPATVTIPAGSYYAYFNIQAQDTLGTIQITASAPGYGPPTPMTVQVTAPKFVISTNTAARTTQGPQGITVYATDANGNGHYTTEAVKVGLASSRGTVFTVDSTFVTIPAGAYYNNAARWLPGTSGGTSAQLTAYDCTGVASGCPPSTRPALYAYTSTSANLSVLTPNLAFSWGSVALGLGQYIDQSSYCCYYLYTSDYLPAGANVTLGHSGTAKTAVPATAAIAPGSYYSYFKITGTARGTDTLTASLASPLHNSGTAYVVVDYGRVFLQNWPASFAAVGDSVAVTLYTRDPGGGSNQNVAAATTFTLAPNANIEFRSGGASSTVITSVVVPADQQSVTFYVKAKTTGAGSVTISNANYQTYTNTVTVP